MWEALASVINKLLDFFLPNKKSSSQEEQQSANTFARSNANITRDNQDETDVKINEAVKENESLNSSVSDSSSLRVNADSINEAIRRANSKADS